MRRIVFSLIFALTLHAAFAQGYEALYGNMQRSLVALKGNQIFGYGFFVDKNLVVASYSNVSEYTYAAMSFLNHDKTYTVSGYVAADPENDLVLLQVVCDSGVAVTFAPDSAVPGTKVLLVDPEPSSINKIISCEVEVVKTYGEHEMIRIKGGVLLNNPGFPVLGESGQVYGMSRRSPLSEMNINFAVPVKAIKKLLQQKSTLKKLEMLKPSYDKIGNQNRPADEKSTAVKEYLDQGNARMAQKDYKGAIDKFTQALRINPNDADAYVFRGQAKYLQMEYKDAIVDFNKAIDIQSDYAEAFDLRGIAKAELGDKIGACEDWQKAYELGFNPAFKLLKEFCDIDNMK